MEYKAEKAEYQADAATRPRLSSERGSLSRQAHPIPYKLSKWFFNRLKRLVRGEAGRKVMRENEPVLLVEGVS
jgi:hypothetical protein